VSHFRGGDKSPPPTRFAKQREKRSQWTPIRKLVQGTILNPRSAAPTGGSGGGISDHGVQGTHVYQPGNRRGILKQLHPCQPPFPLAPGTKISAGQRSPAHPIRHEVNNSRWLCLNFGSIGNGTGRRGQRESRGTDERRLKKPATTKQHETLFARSPDTGNSDLAMLGPLTGRPAWQSAWTDILNLAV
jgi:hypothetical protein